MSATRSSPADATLAELAETVNLARYYLQRLTERAIVLRRLGELASAQGDLQLQRLVMELMLTEWDQTKIDLSNFAQFTKEA